MSKRKKKKNLNLILLTSTMSRVDYLEVVFDNYLALFLNRSHATEEQFIKYGKAEAVTNMLTSFFDMEDLRPTSEEFDELLERKGYANSKDIFEEVRNEKISSFMIDYLGIKGV